MAGALALPLLRVPERPAVARSVIDGKLHAIRVASARAEGWLEGHAAALVEAAEPPAVCRAAVITATVPERVD